MRMILNALFLFAAPQFALAHVILLDGVPASGKSTLSKHIQKELDFELVEADQIAISRNADDPNWMEGLDLGWKEVIKLHKAGRSVVFDAWFDTRYSSNMKEVGAKSVLVFLRLDLLLHRYTQRRMGKRDKRQGGVANPAEQLSKNRIQQLTEDYFKRFYFTSTSKDLVLVSLPTGLNLYSRRSYDAVVDTGLTNLDGQFIVVKAMLGLK